MSDLLIEILTEELPARFVDNAQTQLMESVVAHLDEYFIQHGDVHGFSTPRRLVVLAQNVKEQTDARTTEVKGPARASSYDAQGNPTPALLGFCRGQGVEPSDAYIMDVAGRQYVYARKTIPGQRSSGLVEAFLPRLPRELTFPKMMHWEESGFQFARPIRGLLALLGPEVLHWEVAGVVGSNTTYGLRVGKPKPIAVASPEDYMRKLREAFVIVDPAERRRLIEKQAEKLLKPLGYKLGDNMSDLLDEVVNLVEYPSAFLGDLPEIAAGLPESVVRSVLQQQMHSFLLYDQNGNVVPHFLSVRNGLTDFIDIVRRGNESVANARLLDAAFFIQEDMREPLEAYVGRLDTLIFMDKLGTMAAKTLRLERLADRAAEYSSLTSEEEATLTSAAHLSKADLATSMVKEYTSLQGEIGSVYLSRAGGSPDVVSAIREQYVPRSPGEGIAATRVGRLLGVVDKVDTLVGILSTGFNPSGSEDPYGLRRAGNGIVRTVVESRESVDLETLVSAGIEAYRSTGSLPHPEELQQRVLDYLRGRVAQYFKEKQLTREYAALESLPIAELGSVPDRMQALHEAAGDPALLTLSDSHRRIQNITKGLPASTSLPADLLLTDPEEVTLKQAAETTAARISLALERRDYLDAIHACEELSVPVTLFFDHILVMAPDERVRSARLLLLCYLKYILGLVCDYSKLT
ncbi:MAG TPA: glycine--tRNA ligase subunit beta [Clostridia bacterium]|nr:glycine--tRNA ligase subunit beta [Clostridia bacterium]